MTSLNNAAAFRKYGKFVISPDGILTIFRPNSFKKLNDSKSKAVEKKEIFLLQIE